jgi:hypothetical protein
MWGPKRLHSLYAGFSVALLVGRFGNRIRPCGVFIQQPSCRYTCFNQRARVSLYCDTYALLVDGCLDSSKWKWPEAVEYKAAP